jgi:2-amino-4-hydroxy-6-hydroxymethyldihydropteridine diphosphokinase
VRRAYLGIGSNVGDRLAHLQLAVDIVGTVPGLTVVAVSPVYETDPVGGPVQDDFLNAVIAVETSLEPRGLLLVAQAAERAARRVRDVHWGPRTLDVDVLLFADVVLNDPDLTIPHPWMYERAFVLAPLHDLDPTLAPEPAGGWVGVRRVTAVLTPTGHAG